MLMTVTGPLPVAQAGVVDAHNHAWIDPVPGGATDAPILNQAGIVEELVDYRKAGGGMLVDCQPAGCGRNGNRLRWLSETSGVKIVAVTGYHRRKYYPPDNWLFQADVESASQYFIGELNEGLLESQGQAVPPRAGLVKIACEATLEGSPQQLMKAAVTAAVKTGTALAVHTERGAQAEQITRWLVDRGMPPERLILFHMDKRPDLGLHCELSQQGILLEYDTFFREKYNPQVNAWPLLEGMVSQGWDTRVAIGTDLAEAQMWTRLGGGPGLTGLFKHIIPQMQVRRFEQETIRRLTGENIAARLAISPITR